MAAAKHLSENSGMVDSIKADALSLLNLFQSDISPSDTESSVDENRNKEENPNNGEEGNQNEIGDEKNDNVSEENQGNACEENHISKNVSTGIFQDRAHEREEDTGGTDQRNQESGQAPGHQAEVHLSRVLTRASVQQIIHKAVGVLVRAAEEEKKNSTLEAFKLYKKGLELLFIVLKEHSVNSRLKQTLRRKIEVFLTKAEHLKEHLQHDKNSDGCTQCGPNKSVNRETRESNNFFEGFILDSSYKRNLDDVKGQEEALQALKESLILPLKFPQLFVGRYRINRRPILLFGHPGTGKSMMMAGIASELPDYNFMRLSVWDLTSKYLSSDPERAVKEMFRFFIEKSPCVLILEDIETIEREIDRDDNNQNWRKMKTELLVQMESFYRDDKIKENKLAIVFVTQRPWYLTASLRRRLDKRIFFVLPNQQDRVEVLKSVLSGVKHNLVENDFQQLGDMAVSAGGYRFTHSDLMCLCRDAMMQSVRKIQQAKYFKQVAHPETDEEGFWIPCDQGDDGAKEMFWMDLDMNKILEPVVEMSDFLQSLKNLGGTIDSETEALMQQWVEDFTHYGQG